jgi:hypothetical protein
MLAHIYYPGCNRYGLESSIYYCLRTSYESDYRSVGGFPRIHMEQSNPGHITDNLGDGFNLICIAPFTEIGYTLYDFFHDGRAFELQRTAFPYCSGNEMQYKLKPGTGNYGW